MATVLVSGGTGFVGSWCVKLLLDQGYKVRTTVRDPKSQKAKFLQEWASGGKELEIIKADLMDSEQVWEKACRECKYVLHVASPFPSAQPKDEQDLIKPAKEGTLSVLRAAHQAGVERVVVCSSMAANQWHGIPGKAADHTTWSIPEKQAPYMKSKTLAEMAAWEFIKSDANTNKMELATVLPSFIVGPTVPGYTGTDFTSSETFVKILNKQYPGVPPVQTGYVDVRDVAAVHIKAMASPKGAGERFLACERTMWMRESGGILAERWPDRNLKIKEFSTWQVHLMSYFIGQLKLVIPRLNQIVLFDNSNTTSLLEHKFRDAKQGLIEMSEKLVADGFVRPVEELNKKSSSCSIM